MTKPNTLTVGIDLGDEYSQICVLDPEDEVLEEGKIRTTEAAFRTRFEALKPCLAVMEVGTHSPWVSRLLDSLGHKCLVANPAVLHRKGRKKSDRVDAEKLARRGRSDPEDLEAIQHASAEIQADMAMLHSRRSLIETRTKLINRCRGLVKSWGERLPKCDADYFAQKMPPLIPPQLASALTPLLRTIALLTVEVKELDKQIKALATGKYGAATLHMRQVRGIAELTALGFVLTIRQPERFAKSRQVGPYLGMTRRQDQSGESDVEHSISKAGNEYLRQLFVQAAHYVLERGPDSDIKRWGLHLAAGGKRAKRRAVIAVARKLAVLLHHLWITGQDYVPLREEGEKMQTSLSLTAA
jgi:transposase